MISTGDFEVVAVNDEYLARFVSSLYDSNYHVAESMLKKFTKDDVTSERDKISVHAFAIRLTMISFRWFERQSLSTEGVKLVYEVNGRLLDYLGSAQTPLSERIAGEDPTLFTFSNRYK